MKSHNEKAICLIARPLPRRAGRFWTVWDCGNILKARSLYLDWGLVMSIFPSTLMIAGGEGKMPAVYESVARSRSALRSAGQVLCLAKGRAEGRASNEIARGEITNAI